jgi:hypothetical protein
MGDPINVSLPCLDPLETITVAGGQIHIHRLANVNHSGASQPMAMLLLYDLRTILSEPNVSEQAALSRITKLQKRFYSMDELGLNLTSCANSTHKNKNELPETVIKQLKTSSKANGLWFVTVDAALKIAFKFCTPQDAIRISLDLSPFLVASYATSPDPLEVLESVNVDNLPKEFQLAMERRMKEKRSKARFCGSDAVDWLVKVGAAATRTRASEIASRLLSGGLFRGISAQSPQSGGVFADKSTEYYCFGEPEQSRGGGTPPLLTRSASNSPQTTKDSSSSGSSIFTLNFKKLSAGSRSNSAVAAQYSPKSSGRVSLFHTPTSASSHPQTTPQLSQPFNVYILGADRSGKSSVWSALTGKRSGFASVKAPFDRPWNHVQLERVLVNMDTDEQPDQHVILSVWDFDIHQNTTYQQVPGLQSLTYFVHRAYINRSPRCAALVVFDVNSLDLVDMDYWVASIVQHQPSAPIIIVGTHSDTVSAKTKSKIKLFVTTRYAKVKNVRGFISISTKSSSDVDKLRGLLLQHSLHSLSAQIKRERPQLSLDASLERAIETVAENLNNTRMTGTTFIPLADIRADLLDNGVPEDQVETALGYLSVYGAFIRIPETLDQFTNLYGKPESDIKLWAILDFDYFFKILYALNAAPPMLKMRGLISLATVMEAWKAVGVPHEFMLDLLALQYHMLRTTYCMVSLLINTVIQEKALAQSSREDVLANHSHSATKTKPALPTTSTTRLTSSIRPAPLGSQSSAQIQQKVLARVPNPESHCFSLPAAIPKSFDQKALGWSRPGKNELVRVYSFERLPGQLLERSCIQLVLAVLTQLRTPFLPKNQVDKQPLRNASGQNATANAATATGTDAEKAPKSHKRPKRRPSASPQPDDAISSNKAASDSRITHSAPPMAESYQRSVSTQSPSKRHRQDAPASEESQVRQPPSHATAPASTTGGGGGGSERVHRVSKSERSGSTGKMPKHKKSRESLSVGDKDELNIVVRSTASPSKRKVKSRGNSQISSTEVSSSVSTSTSTSNASHETSGAQSNGNQGNSANNGNNGSVGQGQSPTGSSSPLSSHPLAQATVSTTQSPRSASPARPKRDDRSPERQALDAFSTKGSNELLQALQDIVCEHIEWTHQGISFTVGGENGFSARLYSIEGPQHETALVIRVTSDTSAGSSRGLRLVLDNINAFVLWEYQNALSDIFIPCSCADCQKARSNPKFVPLPVFKNAATFTFEECERAIGSGFSSLPCSVYGNEVQLDSLVPDLVMSDLENFHAEYDEIIKEKELARSSNGIVYKGQYKGETVAIKEITVRLADGLVDSVASEYFADFRHEVWVSSLLKHENVVSLKAFAIKSDLDELTGERVALLAIVMEFIPHGDLYDWIHDPREKLDWDMRLRIAEEIAQGMHFLHTLSPPILHHDLKSANIFIVDKDPNAPIVCRVGDFGEARTSFSYNSRERVDNPLWLAPEVMQKQRYEMWADVYAFGIIMWELVTRDHPFDEFPEGKSDFRSVLEDAIIGGLRPTIDHSIHPGVSLSSDENACIPLFAELMKECWQTDRFKRPTFARIISTLQDIRAAMAMDDLSVRTIETPATAEDSISSALASNRVSFVDVPTKRESLTKVEQEWVDIVESVERASDDAVTIAMLHAESAARLSPRKSNRASVDPQASSASDSHPAASIPFNGSREETTSPRANKISDPSSTTSKSNNDPSDTSNKSKEQLSANGSGVNLDPSPRRGQTSTKYTPFPTPNGEGEGTPSAANGVGGDSSHAHQTPICIVIPPPSADSVTLAQLTSSPNSTTTSTNASSNNASTQPKELSREESIAAAKEKVLSSMQGGGFLSAINVRRSSNAVAPSFEALLSTHAHASKLSVSNSSIARDRSPTIGGISLRKRLAASAMIPVSAIPDDYDHDD